METIGKIKTVLRNVLGTIACPILIISLCVTITLLYKPLYYHDIREYNLVENTGMSQDEILENYNALINYNTLFGKEELEFPSLPMSETGRIHFAEVKKIFVAFQLAAVFSLILFTPLLGRSRLAKDFRWLRATAIVIAVLILGIAAVFLIGGWDRVFVWFHKLMFNNDFWIFDERTDPIINLLPDGYFLHCAIMILINVTIGAAICEWRYRVTKKQFAAKRPVAP